MQPVLSIVVPNRNHKHRLPRLLDSILRQQGVALEVIIVDDCSDEPCEDIAAAFRSQGLPVRVLAQSERLYTKNARLVGTKAAHGRIIAFADADDTFCGTEDTFFRLVRLFDEKQADIVHFRTNFTDENGNFLRSFFMSDPFAPELAGKEIFTEYLATDIRGTVVWNKLYARDLVLSIADVAAAGKTRHYAEDIYLTPLLLLHAGKYIGSDLTGYGYNWVGKDREDALERAVAVYHIREELLRYLPTLGHSPEVVKKYARFLEHYICMCTGHLGLAVGKDGLEGITDETVDELLQTADIRTIIKVLIWGGKMNAEKIITTSRILRYGLPQ